MYDFTRNRLYKRARLWLNSRVSTGDGRDGKVRSVILKGELGGNLAGLSLPRQIVTIALWPLLEQVMSFICSCNTVILSNNLGTTPEQTTQIAAGMGVVSYVMWMGFLMQGSVAMGATAIVSRMTGARRFGEANYAANQSATMGLMAGIVSALLMYFATDYLIVDFLGLVGYAQEVAIRFMRIGCLAAIFSGVTFAVNAALRGAGDTRTPFFVMLSMDGLQVVFSLILTQCFGMDIEGLAWGMILAMAVTAAFLVGLLVRRTMRIKRSMGACTDLDEFARSVSATFVPPIFLRLHSLVPQWDMVYRIVCIGFPQAVEVCGVWLVQIYVMRIISSLGDAAVGAHNIAIRIESLSFLPGFAVGIASATLVGQYLGARNPRMAVATVWKCTGYALLFMGLMGVVFFAFPELFIYPFAAGSQALVDTARPVVQLFLIAEPVYATMMLFKTSLRGAGDTRRVMYVTYTCMGIFRFVVLFLWNRYCPESITLVGIWSLFVLDMAIQSVILYRLVTGLKWTRKKV